MIAEQHMHICAEWKKWIADNVAPRALCNIPTLWFTAAMTAEMLASKVPGALVECGVFQGAHIGVFGYMCQQLKQPRPIWACDSFEGIPKGGPRDKADITDLVGVGEGSSGVSACSLPDVATHLAGWGLGRVPVAFLKGWFEETMQSDEAQKIDPIALLRLDGDLYSSTVACLDGLYDKVHQDGVIIVDDWNLTGVRDAVNERLEVTPVVTEGGEGDVWWYKRDARPRGPWAQ